jgi:hypothetical protein
LLQLTQRVTEAGAGSETSASQFKRLGIEIRDTNQNLKSVGAIFEEIADKAEKAGLAESELAALQQIFGEEASKKLLPVLGRFGELRKAIIDANLVIGVDGLVWVGLRPAFRPVLRVLALPGDLVELPTARRSRRSSPPGHACHG